MIRVQWHKLDGHPVDGGRRTLAGQPFTGVACADEGENLDGELGEKAVRSEWTYRDGLQWGPQQAWFPDGQLARSRYAVAGVTHGVSRWWFPGGKKLAVAQVEYGVTVRSKSWDREGFVVQEYALEADPQIRRLRAEQLANRARAAAVVAAENIPEEYAQAAEEDWQ